ncbi:hypothetical protein RND81_03G209800 [Saponaria officinalis]|uniref:Uncharacterized protein n=1 Tax=Saponaria officinalis TaxID=3572 RepID=A0AAW1M1T6_SAPOF
MEYMLCSSYKFSVLCGILFSKHVGMVFHRISIVFQVCIKTLIIIFTLEDKGGFKGTGEDGTGMEIIWATLTNVNFIATISSTVASDICVACVRYLFCAFDLGMDQMSSENERCYVLFLISASARVGCSAHESVSGKWSLSISFFQIVN